MAMRVGFFPQHQGDTQRDDLKWIKGANIDWGGFTEVDVRIQMLRESLGGMFHVFPESNLRYVSEAPAIVRRDPQTIDIVSTKTEKVGPGIPGSKISHPRFMTTVRFKHRERKCAIINVHWDAGLQARNDGRLLKFTDRVKFTRNMAKEFEAEIEALRTAGYHAIWVMGDFNYRNFPNVPNFVLWYYSPHRILKRQGMTYYADGVCGMGWTKDVGLIGNMKIVRPGTPGNHGDHNYLIGDFGWKTRRD